MKNKNFKTASVSFLIGAIVGISALAFTGFTTGESTNQASNPTISATQANDLFKKYYESAQPSTEIMKGMCIDMNQYNAMKSLVDGGTNPAGFRLYFGKDDQDVSYGIVVGVNSEGKDMTNNDIYQTSSGAMGPCPNVCDAASSITAN